MRMRIAMLVAALAALSAIATAAPAIADNGDGQEACNGGEICLQDLWNNDRYRKHYWWNATYGSTQWWDATNNVYVNLVKDDTSAVRNRDSSCDVKLINVKFGPDPTFTVANDGQTHSLVGVFDQRADKHERINCS